MKDGVLTGFQMTECRRAESDWMSTNLRLNEGWSSYRLPDDWMEESWFWMNEYTLTVEWRMEFLQASRWLNGGELILNTWVQTYGWIKDGVHTGFQMTECRGRTLDMNPDLCRWMIKNFPWMRWISGREWHSVWFKNECQRFNRSLKRTTVSRKLTSVL